MRAAGGQWARLADLYDEYRAKLQAEHRCDFSHLQLQFLEFLQTPEIVELMQQYGFELPNTVAKTGINAKKNGGRTPSDKQCACCRH